MENDWLKKKAILIVDDESQLLIMLREIFEGAGYRNIMTASSGEEALKQIEVKMPDMVITDVMMPGIDGFALLQEIRALSRIPVLMLTARGEAEDRFAGFSRWYLEDYPVLVQKLSLGLLVVGYQPDDILGISMVKLYYVTDSGFLRVAAIGSVLLIVMNILMVILLFWRNTKKIEKEIVPIIHGIEDISKGKSIELPKEGELANINEKLNLASEHIRKKEKTRAEWINGISHDVRTPLSLIMGYAGEIKDDIEVSAKTKKQADIIVGQAEKIKRLITDLNLVSKLESSMQPLRKESLDLLELGRQVISDFLNNGLDEKYEIDYDTSVVSKDYIEMEGDKFLLRRMLENLIQNSISHNPEGCHITLSIREAEDSYMLTVFDDGLGVVQEKLEQLNQGLISDGDYMENGEAAHGYGLKLVRQIVEAHQGTICFRQSDTKGFCTEITL